MWKTLLKERIREDLNRLTDADLPIKEIGLVPSNPDPFWSRLTPLQQLRKIVGRQLPKIDTFGELEVLRMLGSEVGVNQKVRSILNQLCAIDKPNAYNATLVSLLDTVTRKVTNNSPLEFFSSLCIEKNPEVRLGKLCWFCDNKREATPNSFTKGVQRHGWRQMRSAFSNLEYPCTVRLLHRGC